MKMILSILFAFVLIPQENWQLQPFAEGISLLLPPGTKLLKKDGQTGYAYQASDIYLEASLRPLPSDSLSINSRTELIDFYQQQVEGIAKEKPAYTLFSNEEERISGGLGMKFIMTENDSNTEGRWAGLLFVANKKLCVLSVTYPESAQSEATDLLDQLKEGLVFNEELSLRQQLFFRTPADEQSYAVGYFIGNAIFYLPIIGFALFLLYRWYQRRQANS